MKIDNVAVTRERGIVTATTSVHGFAFTHSPDCGILDAAEHATISDHPVPWTDRCDCFLSRITVTQLPDGTLFPQLEDRVELREKLRDEQLRSKYWHGEYKDLRRRFMGMFAIALAGWGFSIARGVWGF